MQVIYAAAMFCLATILAAPTAQAQRGAPSTRITRNAPASYGPQRTSVLQRRQQSGRFFKSVLGSRNSNGRGNASRWRTGLPRNVSISPVAESAFTQSLTRTGLNAATVVNNVAKVVASAIGRNGRGRGVGQRVDGAYIVRTQGANRQQAFESLGGGQRAYLVNISDQNDVVRVVVARKGGNAFEIVNAQYVGPTSAPL